MAVEWLIQFLTFLIENPWVLVKILFLIGFFIYICFALIVVRQVDFMIRTLNGLLDLPLRLLARVNLVLALAIFVFALIFL